LAGSVGPEVEKDRAVTLQIEARRASDDEGLDELVGDATLITTTNRLDWIVRLVATPVHNRVERTLGALPTPVTVHRVVATGDGRDPVTWELDKIVDRRVRRDISAVREGVDPRLLRREAQERTEVVDVRVHTAVGYETEEMDPLAALERAEERRVRKERAILDRFVHAHEILKEHTTRADREVADLAVSHLSRRQADGLT
jgi:hypothetical protein